MKIWVSILSQLLSQFSPSGLTFPSWTRWASSSKTYYMCFSLFVSVIQFYPTLCNPMDSPMSTVFSRQEYWSGLLFPSPGHLPDPWIGPLSFASPALAGRCFTPAPPGKLNHSCFHYHHSLALLNNVSEKTHISPNYLLFQVPNNHGYHWWVLLMCL